MLTDIIEVLACPQCGARVALAERTVRCAQGHAYDVARQGYVSMLSGGASTGTADTAEMVESRDRFLSAEHYAPIAETVGRMVAQHAPRTGAVVEVGAGTGYYLARALEGSARAGVAVDISKYAARRAAKVHPRVGAVVADAWGRLPIGDACAAAVLDVFAPRNPAEFRRVLVSDGVAVVVVPTPSHLRELIGPLGLLDVAAGKLDDLDRRFTPEFERIAAETTEVTMRLSHDDILALARMGPSAWHTERRSLEEAVERFDEPFSVTLSVTAVVYRRNS